MKRLLIALCFALLPVLATAGGGSSEALDEVQIDLSDKSSLQRGARTFVNYCLSCHSAAYMRYERMAADLDINDQLLRENLMFAASKPGELMTVTMSEEGAEDWFGVVPPDLSLTARSHGPDWIYTYLRSFYQDDSTVTGWNNLLFPNVAMPHVLYRWQGLRDAHFEEHDGVQEFVRFEDRAPGELSHDQYDAAVRDLTNFMVYLAEPAKLVRYKIGFWVMVFMAVLILLSYALKREYWRDIH
mgnify:FL=1|tara:strand:+ start:83 stop:811 length:729 start_codon:yes stop_codon:yes gene_type:complete